VHCARSAFDSMLHAFILQLCYLSTLFHLERHMLGSYGCLNLPQC